MKIKIATFLSLAIWICGGLYFYTNFVKSNRAAQHQLISPNGLSTNKPTANELDIDSTSVVQTIDSLSSVSTTIQYTLEPKTINTGFNLTDFTPDEDFKAYANQILDYLINNPDKTLNIIGHTDSVGDDEVNFWVSQQRANTVENYFINLGIKSTQILVTAKGELEPIDTNNTIEGRRKNRRVELIIN